MHDVFKNFNVRRASLRNSALRGVFNRTKYGLMLYDYQSSNRLDKG